MKFANLFKRILPDALFIALFALISFVYFQKPVTAGYVLGGHDNDAATGMMGTEYQTFSQGGDEIMRWTGVVFSGMPTYQISPSYEPMTILKYVGKIFTLGTDGAFSYVFLYLIGFYILLRALRIKPWISAFGAVAWAFSSYFFIIIGAGHIWKAVTLAYIPPTIGGLLLCYRDGRRLLGGALLALFTAMQLLSNHMQMTYYFLFPMALVVVAFLVEALFKADRKAALKQWVKGSLVALVAGFLGIATNLPNVYHTWEYSKETMRGKSELTQYTSTGAVSNDKTDGLDRSYITRWSYGLDETLTLMIANFNGGGHGESLFENKTAQKDKAYGTYSESAAALYQQLGSSTPGLAQYWGDQPFTVGPVYAGAIICFLFILGLFYVGGGVKWAMLAATVVSLLFAWGHNSPVITDFLIDYMPMYNKFRTVSSALVIAEFTIPFLAMLCLAKLLQEPKIIFRRPIALGISFALTGGVCLLFWLAPGVAGDCLSANEAGIFAQLRMMMPDAAVFFNDYQNSITSLRHAILSADARRSFLMIAAAAVLIWVYARGWMKGWMLCGILALVTIIDMWDVNKRYLNDGNFSDPKQRIAKFQQKTPADEQILQDKDPSYRVLNLGSDTFNENNTSYWHKSIGGYNAAKLRRYQDIIDRCLSNEMAALKSELRAAGGDIAALNTDSLTPVLNMLNARYYILGSGSQSMALRNPGANGNGWFAEKLSFTKGADAEMAALQQLDTKREAVADEAFKPVLEGTLGTGTVTMTSYAPNELHYDVASPEGGLLVLSEVYYPGWTATIDGAPVEIGRVNYILRALRVPAGNHKLVLEYRPASVTTTNAIAYTALALMFLAFCFVLWREVRGDKAKKA